MTFLLEATKVIWLTVLFLIGLMAAGIVVVAGATAITQIHEDMKDAKDK